MNGAALPRELLGARIGVLVGCSSWIVVLGILVLCRGPAALLWEVVVPLLLASLGLGLLVLLAAEPRRELERLAAVRAATSPGGVTAAPRGHLTLVSGGILFVCGLLLLLADACVVPVLQHDTELAQLVRRTGGVLELPRWLATALMAVGAMSLAAALRRGSRVVAQCSDQVPTSR